MIKFIEKERWMDNDPHIGRTYAPIYMVKDGKEYFVINRVVLPNEPELDEVNDKILNGDVREYEAFLTLSEGRYFKLYGFYDNPMEMITEMKERHHTFTDPNCVTKKYNDNRLNGFIDFKGNRNEVSAAFHYRIYDMILAEEIRKAITSIVKRSKTSRKM